MKNDSEKYNSIKDDIETQLKQLTKHETTLKQQAGIATSTDLQKWQEKLDNISKQHSDYNILNIAITNNVNHEKLSKLLKLEMNQNIVVSRIAKDRNQNENHTQLQYPDSVTFETMLDSIDAIDAIDNDLGLLGLNNCCINYTKQNNRPILAVLDNFNNGSENKNNEQMPFDEFNCVLVACWYLFMERNDKLNDVNQTSIDYVSIFGTNLNNLLRLDDKMVPKQKELILEGFHTIWQKIKMFLFDSNKISSIDEKDEKKHQENDKTNVNENVSQPSSWIVRFALLLFASQQNILELSFIKEKLTQQNANSTTMKQELMEIAQELSINQQVKDVLIMIGCFFDIYNQIQEMNKRMYVQNYLNNNHDHSGGASNTNDESMVGRIMSKFLRYIDKIGGKYSSISDNNDFGPLEKETFGRKIGFAQRLLSLQHPIDGTGLLSIAKNDTLLMFFSSYNAINSMNIDNFGGIQSYQRQQAKSIYVQEDFVNLNNEMIGPAFGDNYNYSFNYNNFEQKIGLDDINEYDYGDEGVPDLIPGLRNQNNENKINDDGNDHDINGNRNGRKKMSINNFSGLDKAYNRWVVNYENQNDRSGVGIELIDISFFLEGIDPAVYHKADKLWYTLTTVYDNHNGEIDKQVESIKTYQEYNRFVWKLTYTSLSVLLKIYNAKNGINKKVDIHPDRQLVTHRFLFPLFQAMLLIKYNIDKPIKSENDIECELYNRDIVLTRQEFKLHFARYLKKASELAERNEDAGGAENVPDIQNIQNVHMQNIDNNHHNNKDKNEFKFTFEDFQSMAEFYSNKINQESKKKLWIKLAQNDSNKIGKNKLINFIYYTIIVYSKAQSGYVKINIPKMNDIKFRKDILEPITGWLIHFKLSDDKLSFNEFDKFYSTWLVQFYSERYGKNKLKNKVDDNLRDEKQKEQNVEQKNKNGNNNNNDDNNWYPTPNIPFNLWCQESSKWKQGFDAVARNIDKTDQITRNRLWNKFDKHRKGKLDSDRYLRYLLFALICLHVKSIDRQAKIPSQAHLEAFLIWLANKIRPMLQSIQEDTENNDNVNKPQRYITKQDFINNIGHYVLSVAISEKDNNNNNDSDNGKRNSNIQAQKNDNQASHLANTFELEGWLERQVKRNLGSTYVKRWVVVKDDFILWSKKKQIIDDAILFKIGNQCDGYLNFNAIDKVDKVLSKKNNEFVISVNDKKRRKKIEYVWRCPTVQDRKYWVQGLNVHLTSYRQNESN